MKRKNTSELLPLPPLYITVVPVLKNHRFQKIVTLTIILMETVKAK